MAKKKQNTTHTFGFTVCIGSRHYGVQVRVTGGRWISKAARDIGNLLRWRILATGAALTVATALARLAY